MQAQKTKQLSVQNKTMKKIPMSIWRYMSGNLLLTMLLSGKPCTTKQRLQRVLIVAFGQNYRYLHERDKNIYFTKKLKFFKSYYNSKEMEVWMAFLPAIYTKFEPLRFRCFQNSQKGLGGKIKKKWVVVDFTVTSALSAEIQKKYYIF